MKKRKKLKLSKIPKFKKIVTEKFVHNKNGIDRNGQDIINYLNLIEKYFLYDFEFNNNISKYLKYYIKKMQYYRRLAAYREGIILSLQRTIENKK